MTDLQALYAGICEHSDEDTPRLALADFLDEESGKENAFCVPNRGRPKHARRFRTGSNCTPPR